MKKSPIMPKITLQVKNGKSFCDSLDVAKYFHKRHDHVLRDIDKILDDFNRAGHPKFGESNFILDTYINKQNKVQPRCWLSRDGFIKLTFGYRGEEAIKVQIAYIERFNEMERRLMQIQAEKQTEEWQGARGQLKPIRREFTDVIQEKYPDNIWAYKQYTDLAYKAVTGKTARKLREERGAGKKSNAVDYMTADEIRQVGKKQSQIAVMVEMGMKYDEVKSLMRVKGELVAEASVKPTEQ